MEAKRGGGEVRRVNIIYFLSWMGRMEHPHLIRVNHLNRNGVHLRDVKRWLSELRGKDMPDLFAWSYKRKYKTGYVWQDLMDDDLITPISDNEFVLKGSEISATTFEQDHHCDKKGSCSTRKVDPETEEDSGPLDSETSTTTDELVKANHEVEQYSKSTATEIEDSSEKKKKKKRSSSGATNVFRNLLHCGVVETNDSAMVTIHKTSDKAEICKEETLSEAED